MAFRRSSAAAVACALLASALTVPRPATAATATQTDIPNPDAYTCGLSGYIDFERYTDGAPLSSGAINGVQFTTTGGYTWVVGDWTTGDYNGKYPTGAYTSQGERWAWLGTQQGAGRIDLVSGRASVFSLLVSNNTPVQLDAYGGDGTLLTTAGPDSSNINTGHMTELKITRDTADIAYVVVHDTGNFFLVDSICTNASGVPYQALYDFKQYGEPPATYLAPTAWGTQTLYNDDADQCWKMSYGGCAVTALADVVASYGKPLPNGALADPGTVNQLLGQHPGSHGGSGGCDLIWETAAAAVGYSPIINSQNTVELATRIAQVNHALAQGDLVIAGIPVKGSPSGLHYVVIYSPGPVQFADKSSDYLIVDPEGSPGALSKYDSFDSLNPQIVILHNSAPQPGRPWAVVAHSPVQLLITDPSGAQTGYLAASESYVLGIAGTSYGVVPGIADPSGTLLTPPTVLVFGSNDILDGAYTVQVIGTGSGPYTLEFLFGFGSVGLVTVTGTAAPNVTDTYFVTIAPDQAPTVQRQSTTPPAVSPPCTPANNCYFNTPAPSPSPSATPAPTPTASATATSAPTPVVTPTPKPNGGGVAGATSRPHVTPPPTATLDSSTTGQPSSGTWLVLLALAGLLAAASFAIPTVPRRARRRR